ncbi:putative exonuclease mut-7 -like protein [Trichinella papuae]|uniref:Putative exonuclease mut-7-like protein n=1 Tax=Trichinella papuae TaxID=268474 RepID=A0A0V1NAM2_9BILA|nr:putative exonuclease mut-7 -like protein [Trichinella papuae]KRZ81037.1 putative exonuclease mut-7 -like protein [Trichinella papuae]
MTSAQEVADKLQSLRNSDISTFLLDTFQSWTDPLVQLIYLLENISPEFVVPHWKRLHVIIIEKFHDWFQQNREVISVSNDLLIRAFDIATVFDTAHFHIMANIFQMKSNNSIFVESVRKLARSGRYLDGVVCVNTLQIHQYFELEEIIIPCMFHINSNSTNVLQYLRSTPHLINELFQILDKLLNSFYSMKQYAEEINSIGYKFSRKDKKSIMKSVFFLAKHLEVDTSKYRSLRFAAFCGALKFLCVAHYVNGEINYDGWKEMVEVVLQKYPESINFLVELLCDTYSDPTEAEKWTKHYKVHLRTSLRCQTGRFLKSQRTFVNVTRPSNKPKVGEYLQLPSFIKICFVDNYDTALTALNEISKTDTIGIDSEWRPTLFSNENFSLADVIQIATRQQVYLIDYFKFNKDAKHVKLKEFKKKFWEICHSLKMDLNYIFGSRDFSVTKNMISVDEISKQIYEMCGSHFNETYDIFAKKNNLLSIKQLSDNFDIETSTSFSEADRKNKLPKLSFTRSLNDHCFVYLGYWLAKGERMSNWQRRPLREMQMQYAALDAYAVISVYDRLEDFMSVASEYMLNVKNEDK